jgi:hypothetical protein
MTFLALASWSIAILAVLAHSVHAIRAGSLFSTYQNAGRNWVEGRELYRHNGFARDHGAFIYSPLAAALFVPFSLMRDSVSNVLWRLLGVAAFLGAIWSWLKAGLHHRIPEARFSAVFLLLLPCAIGNLNSGQANILTISLVMFSITTAKLNRWALSALCVALATYLKIYPLAAGLLLALLFPRKLSWRLVVALIALGCFSFLLQRPAYVLQEYGHWITNRVGDDRRSAPGRIAPRDLWLLLRFFQCPVNARAYMAIQMLGGLGIAALCLAGKLKNWSQNRLMTGLFSLVCCWMVLLGPATESATYIILAPAVVLAVVEAFSQPMRRWLRRMLLIAFALLLAGLGLNSFSEFNEFPFQIFQPAGALLFSIYVVIWLNDSSLWDDTPRRAGAAKISERADGPVRLLHLRGIERATPDDQRTRGL